jgi:hypothetical protein
MNLELSERIASMRKLFAATVVVSTLLSTAAFADTLTVGTASKAPVFAISSGNASLVSEVGTASRAPVFAAPRGPGQVVVAVGSASQAPVFALVPADHGRIVLAN